MKKITLKLIEDPDNTSVRMPLNTYRIFLNWQVTNSFTNKKNAAIFQARLNTWVNEIFFEMNFIYASVLYIYRKSWIVIDRDTESKLTQTFTVIDRNLNKLYRSDFHSGDSSFWAFSAIEALSKDLIYCINALKRWRKYKKDWEQIKELDVWLKQLNRIIYEVEEIADPGELGRQIKRRD